MQDFIKYYLYRHVRLDTNMPFYVGIARVKNEKLVMGHRTHYSRAYNQASRSNIWKHIVSKAGYDVEILFESNDATFIKEKEQEFIRLYGRRDKGIGSLVNLTDGGDGIINPSSENKKRMMQAGQKLSALFGKKREIFQYSLNGCFLRKWDSVTEAARSIGDITTCGIIACAKAKCNTYKGYLWYYAHKGDSIKPVSARTNSIRRKDSKQVFVYDIASEELLGFFPSCLSAGKMLNIHNAAISRACLKNTSSSGYKWSYTLK